MTVQQKLCNNRWFRLGVSVVLTLAVVLVFVCAPWSCAHAIVGVDDAVIVILIAALAGCGITFATTGAFDTLEEYVGSLFQEYATDNNTTVYSLTNGLQSNANKLGQIILNNRWLVMIQGFASWLIAKYNLANNNTTNIQTGNMVNGLQLYDTSIIIRWNYSGSHYRYVFYEVMGSCLLIFHERVIAGSSYIEPLAYSDVPFTIKVTTYDGNTYKSETQKTATLNVNSYFAELSTPSIKSNYFTAANPDVIYYNNTTAQLKNYLDGQEVPEENIDIQVGIISLPLDNPDYVAGYGGILDVGADWTTPYPSVVDGIPIEWPDVVADDTVITLTPVAEAELTDQLPAPTDVENLPGGSSFALPSGFGNLRLSDIWHYVHQWVVDTAVAGGLLWNTATVMASPVVNMAYAMVVIAIVFGVMKQLRSH